MVIMKLKKLTILVPLASRYLYFLIFQNSHATILLWCLPPDSLKEYTMHAECVTHSS